MFSKAFHHLVQYSDELQNDLRPTIHCEVLNSLERLHIHRESATTYRSPALFGRVDFSPPISTKSHMKATIDAPYDPLACLRERHAFSLCPDTVANESMTVRTCGPQKIDLIIPGSSGSPTTDLSSSPASSDLVSLPGTEFDPFTSSPREGTFLEFLASPNSSHAHDIWACISPSPSKEENHKSRLSVSAGPKSDAILAKPGEILESIVPAAMSNSSSGPKNLFVANFPSHWGKSDLWDLVEGIPVVSVHVNVEKRASVDNGGTGFINVLRQSDAKSLLSLLDKKIWLIDGCAFKIREANEAAPIEPILSNPTRRNRTIRRHPHKVLDRWRAEQIVGSKQVGSCERHQIAIYKNVSTTAPIALSVIHGSRQRSNRMSCAQPDLSSRTPSPPRNMVEDLRTYLSRSNKYNNQHICHVPPPPAQRPPTRVTPPLRPSDQTSVVARPVPPSYPMSLAPGLTPLTDRSMQYVNIAGIPGAPFAYLAQPAMGGYCFLAPITMFSAPQAFAPGYLRPTNSLYRRNDENDPRVGIQRYW